MDNSELDKSIQKYYLDKKLPEDFLEELKQKLEQTTGDSSSGTEKKVIPIKKPWLVYSIAVAAVVVLFWGLFIFYEGYLLKQQYKTFANEINFHHQRNENLSYFISNFSDLSEEMQRLDFSLKAPTKYLEGYRVVGAKYCSIDGRIAVQVRIIDKNEKRCTLYAFKKHDDKELNKKTSFDLENNTNISLWSEDNVIYGLAQNI